MLPSSEHIYTNPSADQRLLYTVYLRKMWSYWSEAHQVYIVCSLIIATVNTFICVQILRGISEWQCDESRCVGRFTPDTGT